MEMKLLSQDEAANTLNLSRGTLANWRCEGRGPRYLKLGKHIFYRPEDVQAWIERRFVDPEARATSAA